MQRIYTSAENGELLLEKSKSAYGLELFLQCLYAAALTGLFVFIWVMGNHQFDATLKRLFPLFFLIPLAWIPKIVPLAFVVFRGEKIRFRPERDMVFKNETPLMPLNQVTAVVFRGRHENQGPAIYEFLLRKKDGEDYRIDRSIHREATREVAENTASFLEIPLESK